MQYMNALDKNSESENRIDAILKQHMNALDKIQAFARGIITRKRIHCALLSADSDVFANAVVLCRSKKATQTR